MIMRKTWISRLLKHQISFSRFRGFYYLVLRLVIRWFWKKSVRKIFIMQVTKTRIGSYLHRHYKWTKPIWNYLRIKSEKLLIIFVSIFVFFWKNFFYYNAITSRNINNVFDCFHNCMQKNLNCMDSLLI